MSTVFDFKIIKVWVITMNNNILKEANNAMEGFKVPEYKEVDIRLREAAKETVEKVIIALRERMSVNES